MVEVVRVEWLRSDQIERAPHHPAHRQRPVEQADSDRRGEHAERRAETVQRSLRVRAGAGAEPDAERQGGDEQRQADEQRARQVDHEQRREKQRDPPPPPGFDLDERVWHRRGPSGSSRYRPAGERLDACRDTAGRRQAGNRSRRPSALSRFHADRCHRIGGHHAGESPTQAARTWPRKTRWKSRRG